MLAENDAFPDPENAVVVRNTGDLSAKTRCSSIFASARLALVGVRRISELGIPVSTCSLTVRMAQIPGNDILPTAL